MSRDIEKQRAGVKRFYDVHKAEILAQKKAYREAHKEELHARAKAYRDANKGKIAAHNKRYNDANKDKVKAYHVAHKAEASAYNAANKEKRLARKREAKYGLSTEDISILYEAQGGLCAICQCPLNKKEHVDHCHTTGQSRGLLCRDCNLMLGHAHDNIDTLERASIYLQAYKKEAGAQ